MKNILTMTVLALSLSFAYAQEAPVEPAAPVKAVELVPAKKCDKKAECPKDCAKECCKEGKKEGKKCCEGKKAEKAPAPAPAEKE